MKLALALISALILMDYAAAALWKQPSSYVPNKASMGLGYEEVQELEGYLEADQKQDIQSNPVNNPGRQQQRKQRKIYYPTPVMGDKRQIPLRYYLNLDPPMTTGTVEIVFKTPITGANNFYLRNAERDYLLRAFMSFSSQRIGLNSKPRNGDYGEWIYPRGFPFPCCEYITILTMRIDITPEAFVISINGLEIENYPFRPELGPPVDEIECYVGTSGAELISMVLEY